MTSHTARVFVSLCLSAVFAIPIQLSAQKNLAACVDELPIATFDAPGAGTGPGTTNCFGACPGTVAEDANAAGVVTGYFVDNSNLYHGFVRIPYSQRMHFPGGKITTFDAPGAGTTPGSAQGTIAFSINQQGAIAGQFQDNQNVYHGFLRSPSGQFTTFDIPGSNAGAFQGPFGSANINDNGAIAGYYGDGNSILHGFVRSPDGTIQTFDAPGAAAIAGLGTIVALETGLNLEGAVTGWFYDSNTIAHGFVRAANGTITVFDAPGAGTSPFQGTLGGSINNAGEVAGGLFDDNGVAHGFARLTDGFIETGEVPGSGTGPGQGTFAVGINEQGSITAYYTDFNNVTHGSVRYPDGLLRTFNVQAAGKGTGQGTTPQNISPEGAIPGYYTDSNNVNHGFLFTPQEKCGELIWTK